LAQSAVTGNCATASSRVRDVQRGVGGTGVKSCRGRVVVVPDSKGTGEIGSRAAATCTLDPANEGTIGIGCGLELNRGAARCPKTAGSAAGVTVDSCRRYGSHYSCSIPSQFHCHGSRGSVLGTC